MGTYDSIAGSNTFPCEATATHNWYLFLTRAQGGTYEPSIVDAELAHFAAHGGTHLRVCNGFWGWMTNRAQWEANLTDYATRCKSYGIKILLFLFDGVTASAGTQTLTNNSGPVYIQIGARKFYIQDPIKYEPWYDILGSDPTWSGNHSWDFSATTNPELKTMLDHKAFVNIEQGRATPTYENMLIGGGWMPAPGNGFLVTRDFPTYGSDLGSPGSDERKFWDAMKAYVLGCIDAIAAVETTPGDTLLGVDIANEISLSYISASVIWAKDTNGNLIFPLTNAEFGGSIIDPAVNPQGHIAQVIDRYKGFYDWMCQYVAANRPNYATTLGHHNQGDCIVDIIRHSNDPVNEPIRYDFMSYHDYGHGFHARASQNTLYDVMNQYLSPADHREVVCSEFQRHEVDEKGIEWFLYGLQNNKDTNGSSRPVGGYMWGYFRSNGFAAPATGKYFTPAPTPTKEQYPSTGYVESYETTPGTPASHTIVDRRPDITVYIDQWLAGTSLPEPTYYRVVESNYLEFEIRDLDNSSLTPGTDTVIVWKWKVIKKNPNQIKPSNQFPSTRWGPNANKDYGIYPGIGCFLDSKDYEQKTGTSANYLDLSSVISLSDFENEDDILVVQAWYGEEEYDPNQYISMQISRATELVLTQTQIFKATNTRRFFLPLDLSTTDPTDNDAEWTYGAIIPGVANNPLLNWTLSDDGQRIVVRANTAFSVNDRAFLLYKNPILLTGVGVKAGMTVKFISTSTAPLHPFCGILMHYNMSLYSGYLVYTSYVPGDTTKILVGVARWDDFNGQTALGTSSVTYDFVDDFDFKASIERVQYGVRIRAWYNETLVTWAGGKTDLTLSSIDTDTFAPGHFGIAAQNFVTGNYAEFSDFFVSAIDERVSVETPVVRKVGHPTPYNVNFSLLSTPYEGSTEGSRHHSSRWQIAAASDGWDSLASGGSWTTSALVKRSVVGLRSRRIYKARVQYRNGDYRESDWSEPILFAVDGTSVADPEFTVEPFPSSLLIHYPFQELIEYATIETERQEQGRVRTLARRDVPIHVFTLNFPAMTSTDAQTLFNHIEQCRGRFAIFEFTNPRTGQVHAVRYDDDINDLRLFDSGLFTGTIRLAEDLGTKVSQVLVTMDGLIEGVTL